MRKYPAYKDSGIEWVGEIPEHWDSRRFKYFVNLINDKSESNGIAFKIALENIESGTGKLTNGTGAFDGIGNLFDKGDVLFNKLRPYLCKATIAPEDGIGVGELLVLRAKQDACNQYVLYRVLSDYFISMVNGSTYGAKMPRASWDFIGNLTLPFPASDEQQAVADYLDKKTELIDELTGKKRRQIELLKEQRQAVINQAVTKGLDPNVDMKDSGIEWLGDIPKHWDVKKFKFLLKRQKSAIKTGPFGSQIKGTDFKEQGIKVYNQRSVLDNDFEKGEIFISPEKFEELRAFEVFPDDILITTRGTIGKCAIFPSNAEKGVLHPCLIRMQLDQSKISNEYVVWYIQETSFFQENVHYNSDATTIAVIYSETLKEVQIPTPPLAEQQDILVFIKQEAEGIQNTVYKAEKQIQLLQEYRTALISEAVTGKIDVREAV